MSQTSRPLPQTGGSYVRDSKGKPKPAPKPKPLNTPEKEG